MKTTKWIKSWFCVNCHNELSYKEKIYSHGVCLYCGHKNDGSPTIVKTYEKSKRFIKTSPLWKFWETNGYWEYKD